MLVHFAVNKDRDFDVMWFTEAKADERLEKYFGDILIALISLEDVNGRKNGDSLYKLNPGCRICYYCSSSCDLEPLLIR